MAVYEAYRDGARIAAQIEAETAEEALEEAEQRIREDVAEEDGDEPSCIERRIIVKVHEMDDPDDSAAGTVAIEGAAPKCAWGRPDHDWRDLTGELKGHRRKIRRTGPEPPPGGGTQVCRRCGWYRTTQGARRTGAGEAPRAAYDPPDGPSVRYVGAMDIAEADGKRK